jgi:hypothetical protein
MTFLSCHGRPTIYRTSNKIDFCDKENPRKSSDLFACAPRWEGSMTYRGISYPVFGRGSGHRERQVHHHFEGKRAGFYPWKGDK